MKKVPLVLLCALLVAAPATAEIRRLEIAGGWYGDNGLDGRYVSLVPGSRVETHVGRVPLPDGVNVLGIAICPTGAAEFAGQDHAGRGNLIWRGAQWDLLGDSYGVNPVLCDWQHRWHQARPEHGSQGLRYAEHVAKPDDRHIVTGDATYFNPALGIWEATVYDGIYVGQGLAGCIAIDTNRTPIGRYMLLSGECRWVKFKKLGEQIAITMVSPRIATVFLWMNVADLATFPPETVPDEPPPAEVCGNGIDDDRDGQIDEGCPVDPPPVEMEMPADVYATFVAVVEKFPHDGNDDQRRAAMEKAVATLRARHGDRWVWKTEHANLSSPSKDGLGYVPEGPIVHGQHTVMFIFDMINGTTRKPSPRGRSEAARLAYVLAVPPKDWLTGTTPPPQTHPYDGGDNDTGICDRCGRPRADAIHTPVTTPPNCQQCQDNLAQALAAVVAIGLERDAALERTRTAEADLKALDEQHAATLIELDQTRQERDKAINDPCSRVNITGPGWVKSAFGIRCEAKR